MPQLFGPHMVGETHNYNAAPVKVDGTSGVENSPVTWSVDDATLANAVPNTGVGNNSGVIVTLLKAGTVNVKATSTDESGTPYNTSFGVTIVDLPPNNTVGFTFTEVS